MCNVVHFFNHSAMYLQDSTAFQVVVLMTVQLSGCGGDEYDSDKPDRVVGDLLLPSSYPLNG
jgi:hypothetical protein